MFTFFLHKRTGILSEIDRRQSQNQKSRVSTQMGDAVNDRFSHGFKKQLKKLMEENYRWMIVLLRSLSKKSLNPHNTFWKVSLLACSRLTVFPRCLLLGQGRNTEEMSAKFT